MGGLHHDRTGSYSAMWWVGVCFGMFAAIVHLPINSMQRIQFTKAAGGNIGLSKKDREATT